MSQLNDRWYRLDNAAKIYPAIESESNTGTFRMTVRLIEDIDPIRLQKALDRTIKDFPSMAVTMKKGFFWYYLQSNDRVPKVQLEKDRPLRRVRPRKQNGFHFRVMYFNNRIVLETFHVLTDGTGAITFLNALTAAYLNLECYKMLVSDLIVEDSYKKYYNKDAKVKRTKNSDKAKQIASKPLRIEGSIVEHGLINSEALLALTRQMGTSITALITTLYALSFYENSDLLNHGNHPIVISVPINLRKRFPSRSIRNFSYFVDVKVDFRDHPTIEEVIASVSDQLKAGVRKEVLYSHIHNNVKIESSILFRIVPLFIKDVILRIARRVISANNVTSNFSNLGVVSLPKEMEPYITQYEFMLNGAMPYKMNMAACSYQDTMTISISRRIKESSIVDCFFRHLEEVSGLEVERYSSESVEV